MSVYPYKFKPVYKEKIWGGRALERLFGRDLPAGEKIGESWELADLPEGQSVVSNGPDAGKTLNSLLAEKAEEILGPGVAPDDGRFPLLLKLLDANDILSLQVHPDEQAAAESGPPAKFKTECWYIIESRDGYILKGVKPGVTEADFRRAIAAEADGDSENPFDGLLERIDVSAGDFHHLPAGTVHALGPGVVLAEIQTPSYTTYRISDWGRGREVHVEEALKCIHFDSTVKPPGADDNTLVSTPWFVVRRVVLAEGQKELTEGACTAWMVLSGKGQLTCAGLGEPVAISAGDTTLIPAGIKKPTLTVENQITLLEVTLPKKETKMSNKIFTVISGVAVMCAGCNSEWNDGFTDHDPRWEWNYNKGTGYKQLTTIDGASVVEIGITDQSSSSGYSDCSLHETTYQYHNGVFEARLRYAGDHKFGTIGWGFWNYEDGATVECAWFFDSSTGGNASGFQVMVASDSVIKFQKHLPEIDIQKWHIYRVELLPTSTRFFVDGVEVAATSKRPGKLQRSEIWIDNYRLQVIDGKISAAGHLNIQQDQRIYVDWVRYYKARNK